MWTGLSLSKHCKHTHTCFLLCNTDSTFKGNANSHTSFTTSIFRVVNASGAHRREQLFVHLAATKAPSEWVAVFRCQPDNSKESGNYLPKHRVRKAGELAEKSISVIDIGLMRCLANSSGNSSSFVGVCHLLTGNLWNWKFRAALLFSLKVQPLDRSILVKRAAQNGALFCSTYTNSWFISCSCQLGACTSTVTSVCLFIPVFLFLCLSTRRSNQTSVGFFLSAVNGVHLRLLCGQADFRGGGQL